MLFWTTQHKGRETPSRVCDLTVSEETEVQTDTSWRELVKQGRAGGWGDSVWRKSFRKLQKDKKISH